MTREVEPTPFGSVRALEIWENKNPAADYVLTPGEDAYVQQVWALLGGDSSWTSALMNIAHGGAVQASRLMRDDVIAFDSGLRATVTAVSLHGETATISICRPDGTLTSIRKDAREPVLIEKPDPRDERCAAHGGRGDCGRWCANWPGRTP